MKKKDWHRADIIAAIKKKGTTLSEVSRTTGYAPSTLSNAFSHSWPKAEKIIADTIGVHPSEIWPSRYNKKSK
ncbi:helix-turn-helix domain-containing protein [Candidatus Schmidhempelia bombi]|jgi:Ner family transcriptional regulator|uniref:Transcriptional regulator n=1 Tax=Candidatus Schmidhempelia bombi str. Bimp TaxID=1387197 RepID=A0AB94IAS7_9GAMM|nr:helix-turn-helix transcriptional regulator [Candidatus Schmidhempelia bombi]TEA26508.1 transcriptional regulator [Candidatus Schmidhempelia bombi str. Bimp]